MTTYISPFIEYPIENVVLKMESEIVSRKSERSEVINGVINIKSRNDLNF